MSGCIHIYHGNGKGKTTAALGLALRAAGHGMPVTVAQFLKSAPTGEVAPLRQLGIAVLRDETPCGFVSQLNPAQRAALAGRQRALLARAAARDVPGGVLVLDEVLDALRLGLVEEGAVRALLPPAGELILTGRQPPAFLLDAADYITQMRKERHPYDRGLGAREGVEY